jgi:hypothetical protein
MHAISLLFLLVAAISACLADLHIGKSSPVAKSKRGLVGTMNQDVVKVIAAHASPPITASDPMYMKVLPIYPKEMASFLSLSFMMFFIVFIFTMTRDTKDALIVTNCGAEAISFLKVYGVVPAATGFMVLYSRLSSHYSSRELFYST